MYLKDNSRNKAQMSSGIFAGVVPQWFGGLLQVCRMNQSSHHEIGFWVFMHHHVVHFDAGQFDHAV